MEEKVYQVLKFYRETAEYQAEIKPYRWADNLLGIIGIIEELRGQPFRPEERGMYLKWLEKRFSERSNNAVATLSDEYGDYQLYVMETIGGLPTWEKTETYVIEDGDR